MFMYMYTSEAEGGGGQIGTMAHRQDLRAKNRLAVAPTSREGLPAYGPPAEGPHTLTHTGC